MYIVWGSRLMGKCDVVPGLFHVATKFGHVYYLPLIPTGSFVVLAQSGTTFRGVPVSLSLKSILLAWARTIMLVVGIILACTALVVGLDKHPQNWIVPAIGAVICWVISGLLSFTKFATHASFNRACELAKELGLNEAGYELISKVYGQAVPRGFAVKPAIPTPAMPAPPLKGQAARSASRPIPVDDGGVIPLEDAPAPTPKRASQQPGRIGLS